MWATEHVSSNTLNMTLWLINERGMQNAASSEPVGSEDTGPYVFITHIAIFKAFVEWPLSDFFIGPGINRKKEIVSCAKKSDFTVV